MTQVLEFPVQMRAAPVEQRDSVLVEAKNNALSNLAAAAQAVCMAHEQFEKYKGLVAYQYNLNPSIFTSDDLTTWLAAHHVAKYPPIS
jgi:hypothetical protein